MKYKITVKIQTYEIEIENINARPVIALVDGERFEVVPENADQAETRNDAGEKMEKKSFTANPPKATAPSPNPAMSGNTLTAPLPGTIIEDFRETRRQSGSGPDHCDHRSNENEEQHSFRVQRKRQ